MTKGTTMTKKHSNKIIVAKVNAEELFELQL